MVRRAGLRARYVLRVNLPRARLTSRFLARVILDSDGNVAGADFRGPAPADFVPAASEPSTPRKGKKKATAATVSPAQPAARAAPRTSRIAARVAPKRALMQGRARGHRAIVLASEKA